MLSYNTVCELFNEKTGNQRLHYTTIKRVVDHFRTHHTISRRKESGGRVTAHTVANREDVRQRITNNPRLSVRKLTATIQMSGAIVHRTLIVFLYDKSWNLPITHFAKNSVSGSIASLVTELTLDNCFYSKEAWIHLGRYINSQNYRLQASENRMHSLKRDDSPDLTPLDFFLRRFIKDNLSASCEYWSPWTVY